MNVKRFFLLMLFTPGLYVSTVMYSVTNHPIMGWSSWNTYRVNICDSLIRKQADAIINTGLKDFGYKYINIDDGFFGWRDSLGIMHSHPQRFPDGMKPVADYIHRLGLKAGIYSDAGSNTCGSIWDKDKNGVGSGLYGHEEQDAILYFKDWGFDFIKIDYCGAGQELELDEQRRYTEIRNVINKVGCNGVQINICRWAFPGTWAKDIASSWRISSDISNKWSSVKYIIDKNLYLSAYAKDGHYNDMDMLEIGRGLSQNEEEVHFGMWCIMSSPLLIGCDLTSISPSSLTLLKNNELIAIDQDTLGLQANVVQHVGNGYVLAKDIIHRHGSIRAIALYNPSDTICHFSVPTDRIGLGGKIKLRDLIHHKNLKTIKKNLVTDLPARSVMILKAEGEYLIEPVIYEAENAYLPCYNDISKKKRPVLYAPIESASGGMGVINLGGEKDNIAKWDNVYSIDGGNYMMTIHYVPKEGRKLTVSVNGRIFKFDTLPYNKGIASVTLNVKLVKGDNTIEMGSPYCFMPDIDCFTLIKQ